MRFLSYLAFAAAASSSSSSSPSLPIRGFNSWFAFDTHINDTVLRSNALGLVSSTLAARGFSLIAIDAGWQGGRHSNGTVFANATLFPEGLLPLSRFLHGLNLSFGIYTDRGSSTCDGRVGSAGHEAGDAAYYAAIEADLLKSDSCAATQSHAGALAQYKTMQDALAATGRPITLSLCGWLKWYSGSSSSASIGTSWRIGPDALSWQNVLMNMDAAADGAAFVAPGKYVDVDEVMGPSRNRPINASRTLTQAAFIALVSSPMLISFDLTGRGPDDPELVPFLNDELLAVHWDNAPEGPVYARVSGGQLAPDRISPLTRVPCDSPSAAWTFSPRPAAGGGALMGSFASRAATGLCLMAGAAWFAECNNAQGVWLGTCGDESGHGHNCCPHPASPSYNCSNQLLSLNSDGTITTPYWPQNSNAAGPYLTLDTPTPNAVFFEERHTDTDGASRQQWRFDAAAGTLADAAGTCLGAAPRDVTNVWARRLVGSAVALLFINNDVITRTVTCDADCCAAAGLARDAIVRVRDIFSHTDSGTASCAAGVAFSVHPGGASVFVRLEIVPAMAGAGPAAPAPLLPYSPWPCASRNASSPPWCDASLPLAARINALTAAIPTSDLVGFLVAAPYPSGGSNALNIPPTAWWQEATHGAATRAPNATSTFFPMPSHTAQAFNMSLVRAIASIIGAEGRALGNLHAPTAGWGFWAPHVNPVRDERWGRAQETPSSDVFLSSAWAAAYVRGLQDGDGTDPRYLQVAATAKHFAGYDFEGTRGAAITRSNFDARISMQDFVDSYLPPYQAAVQAGAAGIMAAYTSVHGVPSAANPFLLRDLLSAWSPSGDVSTLYATGDCGAVEQVNTCAHCHNFTATNSSTVAAVLGAGLTMDCGVGLSHWAAAAVDQGVVPATALTTAAARNLYVRFRTGAFDDPSDQPMASWGAEHICTPAAAALSLNAAEAGVVLLKNAAEAGLPLSPSSLSRLALIGGNANDSMSQMCSYYAPPCGGFEAIVTPLEALTAALPHVDYTLGCSTGCGEPGISFSAAVATAGGADATVIVAGLNCQLAGEGNDRTSIALPGRTDDLIAAVCAAAAPRPCVLALATGSSLDISAPLVNDNVTAIISIGYAGPHGGTALARVLLGAAPPPAGRLATTWYRSAFVEEVNVMEMGMRPGTSILPPFTNPGHTHRFYSGHNTLLPFGFARSYTTWVYTPLSVPRVRGDRLAAACAGGLLGSIARDLLITAAQFAVNVTNSGSVDSDDVVLGFLIPPGAGQGGVPLQELFAFERVFVRAGETVTVFLGAQGVSFTQVGADGMRYALLGEYTMRFGVSETARWGGGHAEVRIRVE